MKLAGGGKARLVESGPIMLGGRNPVAARRRLLGELRRLRAAAGLTQKEVSAALEWSMSKVIRIEGGTVGISITDLKALLALYGVEDPSVVETLSEAARAAREKAWWDDFRGQVDPTLINFIAVEASATSMGEYQAFVVPGILQTPAYIRALSTVFDSSEEAIERAVFMRTERRLLLTESPSVEARFILDEAAISRTIGSAEVMREQLDFLVELNRLPNVAIQVATFDRGVTDGMQSSFTLFELPDQDHVVYLDQPGRVVLARTDPDEVARYLDAFDVLKHPDHASPADELEATIDRIRASD
ncbi:MULTISPECIES: helix-turn-helix transcriptional regulator [unclassified Amycolatopsis]|uniref:helix-turn-helix domain-containing protein n=1 Tax=unclassified Amycolatopsis TaxID=2618356 RepID=UPI00287576E9|nr:MULTISPECIES: helix-turn-helix transcriptional regulator [unclassified Amycolatopsis]MDS0139240.1 helix-turn-helix domain-containing protein [Amycolatopsis sp. 505]MDS0144472.1 helix-turn-helix domain-containing protein [Amycolatopsis sp. CM201R]